jgi:glycosyltransferase involved in cell wall biosynthesis
MEKMTEQLPLVSIVLPTYNRARMLSRAISSVIEQSYQHWELFVIDNHSSDDTESVVHQFKDERITLIKIENEGSIGKSRNRGVKEATGEWVAFLDDDDWWFPDKLSQCLLECRGNVDLIFHDLLVSVDGRVSRWKKIKGWSLSPPVIKDLMIRGNAIANSSVMVRRSVIEAAGEISEDANVNPSVDYNTWLKIANITDSFKYISKVLGAYLVHNGGVSQRDMSISYEYAIADFRHTLSEWDRIHVRRNIDYMHGRFEYLQGNYALAEKALKNSLSGREVVRSAKCLFMLLLISFKKKLA